MSGTVRVPYMAKELFFDFVVDCTWLVAGRSSMTCQEAVEQFGTVSEVLSNAEYKMHCSAKLRP